MSEKGVRIGVLPAAATTAVSSVSSFTRLGPTVGLTRPSSAGPLISSINTTQVVPLSASMGSRIRLLFEATGSDGKTRIMYLDSVDGYVGQDFNRGSATVCGTSAEYASGGDCAPTVILGVEGDPVAGKTNIRNARQFKIGYPALTDWRWDGAPGTFMIFTVETNTSCSTSNRTQGYAVWDGAQWNVQYAGGNCPKMFVNMQAPMPMHLAGVQYKLYYSDTTRGSTGSGGLPAPGPVQLIYADGALTGNSGWVDFEDWEGLSKSRDVHFLWPSGTELTTSQEAYLDDYVFLAPTGDTGFQVMYSNVTDGTFAPFIAMAVLVNP